MLSVRRIDRQAERLVFDFEIECARAGETPASWLYEKPCAVDNFSKDQDPNEPLPVQELLECTRVVRNKIGTFAGVFKNGKRKKNAPRG